MRSLPSARRRVAGAVAAAAVVVAGEVAPGDPRVGVCVGVVEGMPPTAPSPLVVVGVEVGVASSVLAPSASL